jgi:hypothetical protein
VTKSVTSHGCACMSMCIIILNVTARCHWSLQRCKHLKQRQWPQEWKVGPLWRCEMCFGSCIHKP